MSDLTDEQLNNMALDFDACLVEICEKYNMSPLAFSGLALARLHCFSREFDYLNDYNDLLTRVLMNVQQNSLDAGTGGHIQ